YDKENEITKKQLHETVRLATVFIS
ncbi:MAG: hypothetical protein RL596_2183, partial [Bacteroidota bacterium]